MAELAPLVPLARRSSDHMSTELSISTFDSYATALAQFFETRSETALYAASQLSQTFVEGGLGPEDVVALHYEALERAISGFSWRDQARAIGDAHQFLLEVMIAYGIRYKEYLELRLKDSLREVEQRTHEAEALAIEAERSGRERSEILAVIAHELRTPITAAIGSLDLAARAISRGNVERVPRLLEGAREALNRLSRLSADLVEASRGDPAALEMVDLDLAPVLRQACDWAAPAALAASVTLQFDFTTVGETPRVRANSDALLSVVGNLLSNAIRYTPAGGSVSVRYGQRDVEVWVEVADTGIGMSPDVQNRVFQKFYRAPEAEAVEAHGLGLGLSLVQQLVQNHNGRVEVESEMGKGSTFRVLLPRA